MLTMSTIRRCIAATCAAFIAAGSAHAEYDWSDINIALEDSPFLRGALVIYHKGQIVHRTGFGTWSDYTQAELDALPPVNVASLSKTFTAALAMAIDEDETVDFSLNDLVKDHIENATSLNTNKIDATTLAYDVMTIDHLITMTSSHDYFSPWPTNLLTCVGNPFYSFETCGENMVKKDLIKTGPFSSYVVEPGTMFGYSSAPWQILGLVLVNAVNESHATSLDFETIVEDYVTGESACNFEHTTVTPANNEWPAGGFDTDFTDGGKLAQALLSGECGDDHQLLSSASQTAMETNTMPGEINYNPDTTGLLYGRGQFIYDPQCNQDENPACPTEQEVTCQAGAEPGCATSMAIFMGVGAWGAATFYSRDNDWAAYLHVNDHLLTGYADAVALAKALTSLIDAQADANP